MKEKSKTDRAYRNPSYDKTLATIDRLADFLGKYHVVLNGVVAHDPYILREEEGGGMCCQEHKIEILGFVEMLITQAQEEAVMEFAEYVAGNISQDTGVLFLKKADEYLKSLTSSNKEE